MITNNFCCVNSSIGFLFLANVVLATKIMVICGLEPEILAIIVSGVKMATIAVMGQNCNGPISKNLH